MVRPEIHGLVGKTKTGHAHLKQTKTLYVLPKTTGRLTDENTMVNLEDHRLETMKMKGGTEIDEKGKEEIDLKLLTYLI